MQPLLERTLATVDLAGNDAARRVAPSATSRAWGRVLILAVLVAADAISVAGAFALTYVLRFKTSIGAFYVPPDSPLGFYSTLVFWLVPLVIATFAAYRLYALDRIFNGFDEYVRVLSATTMAIIVVILVSFLFDDRLVISRAWMLLSWVLILVAMATDRFLVRRLVYRLRRVGYLTRRVIVLGGDRDAGVLARHLHTSASGGLQVTGVYDPQLLWDGEADREESSRRLQQLVEATGTDAVIVSAASVPQEVLSRVVRELANLPTELHIVPGMYEILTTGVQVRDVNGLPLVMMNKVRITGYDRLLKQALDFVVATLVLVALAPVLLAIALAVRLTSAGPIFHRRRVVGQCGSRFDALKFRTMRRDGDIWLQTHHPDLAAILASTGKLKDDPRITRIGCWLRRWSLDELPQLFNVLRGQMSLVGPRMISEAELEHFGDWRENLSTVKPGLTGLWQVSGRSNLGYEDRVRLDMHYIRSYSIWFDIEILARTIPAVLAGEGAY